MKSRLIFSLFVALIFLSTGIMSYGQEKPMTTAKKTTHTQERQLTKQANTHQMKKIKDDAVTNKKVTAKTVKTKAEKVSKDEHSAKLNKGAVVHHKKLEKKTEKKESNTPQKK